MFIQMSCRTKLKSKSQKKRKSTDDEESISAKRILKRFEVNQLQRTLCFG